MMMIKLNFFRYSCRNIRPELWDFVAERLPEDALEKVEKHIANCAACRNEVETLTLAQNALLDTRLEEVPAPKRGWADLQARLGQQEATGRTALAMPSATWAEERQERRKAPFRHAPNLMLMGSCAMLLLSTFVTYRALSIQQDSVNPAPVPLQAFAGGVKQEVQKPQPTEVAQHHEEKKHNTDSPIITQASQHIESLPKEPKKQTAKKNTEQPSNNLGGYQVMPAGYQDNPEFNVPTPTTSALKFSKHIPDATDHAPNAQKEPEFVMGTLTPAAHEKDAY